LKKRLDKGYPLCYSATVEGNQPQIKRKEIAMGLEISFRQSDKAYITITGMDKETFNKFQPVMKAIKNAGTYEVGVIPIGESSISFVRVFTQEERDKQWVKGGV
jgi:hypothetical protein